MHLKTDPQLTIPLEGDDVEGMQRRRRRAGIDACLNRRQSKPWQGAPLLTADDEFVGQGRCGSLSREQKFLDRLKTARDNPPAPTVHPSDEGVFRAAPFPKGGSQNEQPHLRFHQQPERVPKEGVEFSGDWRAWSDCVSTTNATGWMPCLALPPW